jgi:dTDP-4-dehydrorhamnose 3,5-epimerase
MLKVTDPWFKQFGEIYFSEVFPGAVKGFHNHRVMTINYTVVFGLIQLVLYDARPQSPTNGTLQEIITGSEYNYSLITVPPGVWNGFKGLGTTKSTIANCATIAHDPNEIERHDPLDRSFINYDWMIDPNDPHG